MRGKRGPRGGKHESDWEGRGRQGFFTFCTKEMRDPGGTSAPLMLALVTSDSLANEKAV